MQPVGHQVEDDNRFVGLMFSFQLCKGIGLIVMRLMDDTMG